MKVNAYLLLSETNVKPIYTGNRSRVTAPTNGHAQWNTIPAAVTGKTMTIKLPTNGAFSAYDEQGLCVNNTMLGAKFMLCKYHFCPFSDRSQMIEVSMKPTVITTN
ncbi:hypothetical protein PAENI_27815 [Paenibacillus sp. B2(2019)]|nr:hypothetical protein PAENI_27815 [Paenibacillus sp. B2(2019)]